MVSDPGRGRDGDNDDLSAEPPAFSDEGMRRIVYGDRRMVSDALSGRAPDSAAFAEETAELAASLRRRRNLVPVVTALAAVVCFAAIVWYAYTWGTGQMDSDELPVVRAEPMPEKVKPEQPGGLEVPHQGMAVLNGGSETPQTVERLLPRPEVPAPPAPLPEIAEAAPEVPEFAEPEFAEPEFAEPEFAEPGMADAGPDVAPAQTMEDEIARPQPKPDDQIARLLQKEALETADGGAAKPAEPAPQPPVQAAPAQVAKATAGDIVLQLSSVKSESAATQEWNRLQAAHPALLGTLGLSLETASVQGTTYYRVQTGPFASRDAAAKVCAQLKARDQDCLVKQR